MRPYETLRDWSVGDKARLQDLPNLHVMTAARSKSRAGQGLPFTTTILLFVCTSFDILIVHNTDP